MTFRCFAASVLVLVASSLLLADEAYRVSLLRPDSLVGWDVAGGEGWQATPEGFVAGKDSQKLTGGWTLGDFNLEIAAHGDAKAKLHVGLAPVDGGEPVEVELPLKPRDEGASATTIKLQRAGSSLSTETAGQKPSETKLDGDLRYVPTLRVTGGSATISSIQLTPNRGESIVAQDSLDGWWTPGKKEAWSVNDGVIELSGRGGNYLRSEKEYGNFTLSFEFNIKKGGNSGVGLRTPKNGWPSRQGMELQIYDRDNASKNGMMSIYNFHAPLALAHRSGEWNRLVIKADGRRISAWMNGELVQYADTGAIKGLAERPLEGWVGFQDHGAQIDIRDLKIAEAPAGADWPVWRK